MHTKPVTAVGKSQLPTRVFAALLMLSLAGQLAWAIENQFYNTFLYDKITPNPQAVSWMVSITAVVSTLTTIFMGTLSDRTRSKWGKRKPYLFLGYLFWGIFTALFPAAAWFQPVSLGIFMAILFDSIMTFFGATANDAAFSAYVADVTTVENRGRVSGAVQITTWIAMLIVYGGAGFIIEAIGYTGFFYVVGGFTLLIGLIFAPQLKETPETQKPKGTFWGQIAETFQWKNLLAQRDLFLLLISLTLFMLAINTFFSYLMIYLQHYIKLSIGESSLLIGAAIGIGGIGLAIPAGDPGRQMGPPSGGHNFRAAGERRADSLFAFEKHADPDPERHRLAGGLHRMGDRHRCLDQGPLPGGEARPVCRILRIVQRGLHHDPRFTTGWLAVDRLWHSDHPGWQGRHDPHPAHLPGGGRAGPAHADPPADHPQETARG